MSWMFGCVAETRRNQIVRVDDQEIQLVVAGGKRARRLFMQGRDEKSQRKVENKRAETLTHQVIKSAMAAGVCACLT